MDPYLDLDLECEGPAQADKRGVFKGIFKKTAKAVKEEPQENTALQNPELSASNKSLSSKKSAVGKTSALGGILKRSPKPGQVRRGSQELLDSELTASNDSLSDSSTATESAGMFKGMFKKNTRLLDASTQSEDDLSSLGSTDSLPVNGKEAGGMFTGLFKKKKSRGAETGSQGKSGVLGGILKRSPKPGQARRGSQELLDSELTSSNTSLSDSSTAPEAAGIFTGFFKKKKPHGAEMGSQNDVSTASELSGSSDDRTQKSDKEKNSDSDSDSEDALGRGETQPGHKQWKFAEGIAKLNPFRSAESKDTKNTEKSKEENQAEEQPTVVKGNMSQQETKGHIKTPPVPPRPSVEEIKTTTAYRKTKPRATDTVDSSDSGRDKDEDRMTSSEIKTDEEPRDEDSSHQEIKKMIEGKDKTEEAKGKKPKRHNPFMPLVKAPSDDEELRDEDASHQEDTKTDEGKDKTEETQVLKPKKHNPFMPRVKGKVLKRNPKAGAAGNTAEDGGGSRSLFDQLEDFRVDPSPPEDRENMDNLMDWWNTVESWEDTPEVEDMTEKEGAKAFAVTAEKIQKGIRVFNKLFSERAESLWQHVIDLTGIADGLDKFSKNTKIAQITGGSTSAIGGVATIAGLALAPVTMGTSLIVTAVGLGVATAGGLTSAGAGISKQVNNSMDRKKVEKIVQDYQEKMADLNKCLTFIKQGIENLKKFDLVKMKHQTYNRDFPVLSSSFYEDGAMAGKAILINANEIMRVVQIANVAGSTAARAVQIASMATGVLAGLFVGMDIYFVAKDSKELKKGAKSEFAAKIREVATQLHDGLVELNGIREELQSTSPENQEEGRDAAGRAQKKEEEEEGDRGDLEEDEIERIKKAVKRDVENRDHFL